VVLRSGLISLSCRQHHGPNLHLDLPFYAAQGEIGPVHNLHCKVLLGLPVSHLEDFGKCAATQYRRL
jgi:hypothetical protein